MRTPALIQACTLIRRYNVKTLITYIGYSFIDIRITIRLDNYCLKLYLSKIFAANV